MIDPRVDHSAELTGGLLLWQACAAQPKYPIIIDDQQPHSVLLPHAAVEECMRLWARSAGRYEPSGAAVRTSAARRTTNPVAFARLRPRIGLFLLQWPEVTQAVLYEHREPEGCPVLTLGLCVDEVSAPLQARIAKALPLIGWDLPPAFDIKLLALHTCAELSDGQLGPFVYGLRSEISPPVDDFARLTRAQSEFESDAAEATAHPGATPLLLAVSEAPEEPSPPPLEIEQLCIDVQTHPGLAGLLVERLIHMPLGTIAEEGHSKQGRRLADHQEPHNDDDAADIELQEIRLLPSKGKTRPSVPHTCKALFTQAKYAEEVLDADCLASERATNLPCGAYVGARGSTLMRLASSGALKRPIVIDPGQRHSVVLPCSAVLACLKLWTPAGPPDDPSDRSMFVTYRPAPSERNGLQMRVNTLLRQWPQIRRAMLYLRCDPDVPPTLTMGLCAAEVSVDLTQRLRSALPLLTWGLPARFRIKRLTLHTTLEMTHSMFGRPIYEAQPSLPSDIHSDAPSRQNP